jgi:hypothetical protein
MVVGTSPLGDTAAALSPARFFQKQIAMKSNQNNKLRMYLAVQAALGTHEDVWETLPAFAAAKSEFDEQIGSIQSLVQVQLSKKGGTIDKAYALNTLADAGFEVAAAVRAFASVAADLDLAAKMDYTRSKIVRGRDNQVLARCQNIHAEATATVASLADYGITAAKLTALKKKTDAFAGLQPKPRQEAATGSAATKALPELFALTDRLISERLDGLAFQFKDSEPAFYNEYLVARVVVDCPGGRASKEAKASARANAELSLSKAA